MLPLPETPVKSTRGPESVELLAASVKTEPPTTHPLVVAHGMFVTTIPSLARMMGLTEAAEELDAMFV